MQDLEKMMKSKSNRLDNAMKFIDITKREAKKKKTNMTQTQAS